MKLPELRRALTESGVSPNAYNIEGVGVCEDRYCLEKDGNWWIAYYYERGNKNGLREFWREEEACQYFLEMLVEDPIARR
jgi:hypothetical protein